MKEEKGIVIAENEEDAYWYDIIENTKKELDALNKRLKFLNFVLEEAEKRCTCTS